MGVRHARFAVPPTDGQVVAPGRARLRVIGPNKNWEGLFLRAGREEVDAVATDASPGGAASRRYLCGLRVHASAELPTPRCCSLRTYKPYHPAHLSVPRLVNLGARRVKLAPKSLFTQSPLVAWLDPLSPFLTGHQCQGGEQHALLIPTTACTRLPG